MTYAARTKYDEPGRAARYRERSRRRGQEEAALVTAALDRLEPAPETAWDAPCGTGRMSELLLGRGLRVWAGDLSPAMRVEAERLLAGRKGFAEVAALDLEAVPDDAPRADMALCFRFFHHLPDAGVRGRVWAGLGRLSRSHLLVGFHHPISVHGLVRRVRAALRRRPSDRFTHWPRRLAAEAAAHGWTYRGSLAVARFRRELWLAHFERTPERGETN